MAKRDSEPMRTDMLDDMLDAILIQHLSKEEEDQEIDRLYHMFERSWLEMKAGLHMRGMHIVDQVDLELEFRMSHMNEEGEDCDD